MLLDRVIRAWKDPEFRFTLSEEEQAQLPENPAGAIELSDDELEMATGGHNPSNNSNSSNSSSRSASNSSSNSVRNNSVRCSSNKSWRRPQSSQSSSSRPRWARRPLW